MKINDDSKETDAFNKKMQERANQILMALFPEREEFRLGEVDEDIFNYQKVASSTNPDYFSIGILR